MATQPLDTGAATLFNAHMFDLGNRISAFCNFLLLVDGGILSITIGAFVSTTPPAVPIGGLLAIRAGWYLLTTGLILALSATFFVLIGQSVVQDKLRATFTPNPTALAIHTGPKWVGYTIRSVILLAFLTSVAGIWSVSYGAVQMLRIPLSTK